MPLGELFDLERAAEYCAKINRWSFFVSSEVYSILFQSLRCNTNVSEALQRPWSLCKSSKSSYNFLIFCSGDLHENY